METLMAICLRHVSGFVAGNLIGSRSLQDLPVHLLEELVPLLTQESLGKLHRVLTEKGVNTQLLRLQWMLFHHNTFKRDVKTLHECSCHCPSLLNKDWRQIFLDKSCQQKLNELELDASNITSDYSQEVLDILHNPMTSCCNVKPSPEPFDDYLPASLHLQSRLLPFIQKDDRILELLQRSLKDLVISHYLPKYSSVLKQTLEHLIHDGVLRKFTLKHPKSMTPDELDSILEVCAGRLGCRESTSAHEMRNCCKQTISDKDSISDTCTGLNGFYDEPSLNRKLEQDSCGQAKKQDLYDFSLLEPVGMNPDHHYPGNQNLVYSQDVSHLPLHTLKNCKTNCQSSDHCIQHLVLWGFLLDQPDYSDMLGLWPGLQEFELIDNLLLSHSCAKILTSVTKGQTHVRSLRRLRLEDNSVQGCNFAVTRLLSRCKLHTLELQAADLSFSSLDQGQYGYDVEQLHLDECFAKLYTIKFTSNNLGSLTCLERALAQSECIIKCLDLRSCQLDTKTLDNLFISAKNCMSLHDLNVSFNTYNPNCYEMESSGVYRNQAKMSGLVQLIQTGQLTKLDLSGCHFSLTGWSHAEDFVRALRNNSSLRQFLLMCNDLTNGCLGLLVDAFVSTRKEANLPPRLCLDISYNLRLTDDGLHTFSQALCEASSTPRSGVCPPRHLTISADKVNSRNCAQLAKITNLTVDQKTPFTEGSERRIIHLKDLMMEHLSQM